MEGKSLNRLSDEDMKISFGSFDTVITFCEGVLIEQGEEIIGSAAAIESLKKFGKRILYLSRDSTSSRREISEKMPIVGCETIEPNQIVCVTSLMATYLKKNLNDKRKVYTIGSPGTSEELDIVELPNFGSGPDILTTDLATFVHSFVEDREVGAVVVGFDEHFSYPKMLRAASYLSASEVVLVANSRGTKTSAALVKCVETCSDKKALVIEDSVDLIERILIDDYRIKPDRTVIVGPGKDGKISLTNFDSLKSQLIKFFHKNDDTVFDDGKKNHEISNDSVLYAENLAEIVSCLEI